MLSILHPLRRQNPASQRAGIDLASVRDTLLYIESDLQTSPAHARISAAIKTALAEIERLDESGDAANAGAAEPKFTGARFLPARPRT